jgi:chromosome segregation ATPase
MLNSNLSPNNLQENQSRVDDLMNTILEARKSLQNWEDQKTEALIKLDALTYDIRMIGEEKDRAKETATIIKKEMESEIKVYQNHVDNLSDQIQLLQIEREGLQTQLNQALLENQSHLKELARLKTSELKLQDDLKNGIAAIQHETENRISAKYEQAYNEEIQMMKQQIAELSSQNQSILNQRNEAEERANRFERELGGIRSHMMSVLQVASGAHTQAAATVNPKNVAPRPAAEPKIDSKRLRAVEIESTSVDEYLKRLGY